MISVLFMALDIVVDVWIQSFASLNSMAHHKIATDAIDRAVKSCQKTHLCNRCRQYRL